MSGEQIQEAACQQPMTRPALIHRRQMSAGSRVFRDQQMRTSRKTCWPCWI